MEEEVWLNIDYGQYEITKRTSDSAGAGIGGKIVTKVTVGNADDKVNFFRGCLQVWPPKNNCFYVCFFLPASL